MSVGGEEAGPSPPPGPAGASVLGWAAGAESPAAAAEGPEPRVQPPGVSARGAQRRASAPPRAHAPTQRRGDPGGGRGRACPSEGKGPVLPAQAAAAAAQEAEAAAATEAATCPPQSPRRVGPAPASRPVRKHRAEAPSPLRSVSTSRGAQPWPPAAGRGAETVVDPFALRLSPALTRPGPPPLSGCSGAHRPDRGTRASQGASGTRAGGTACRPSLEKSPSQAPGLSFPVRLEGGGVATTLKFALPRAGQVHGAQAV